MRVCVRERKTQKEGEVICVFQVWCHIMCLSGTVCIPGLPALFIPDSFVLVLSLTLRSSNHSYTCSGQGYGITNVFIHQDGNRLVCCFRKQYAIDSFLEQLIYHGNKTGSRASPTEVYCFVNPMNIVMRAIISPVVMSMCVLWKESSQTGPDSEASRAASRTPLSPHPASTTPQSKQTYCSLSAQFTTATSYGEEGALFVIILAVNMLGIVQLWIICVRPQPENQGNHKS